jgi:hypothetical protein
MYRDRDNNENYQSQSYNLITVDSNGNMNAKNVTPPSLSPLSPTSDVNIVYVTDTNNIAVTTVGDVYTSYPSNLKNLLVCDSAGNFSTISSKLFNPCHVNVKADSGTGAGSMNGIPQKDGTCLCNNNWNGQTPGNGCNVCDGTDEEITHMGPYPDSGVFAGRNCEFSRVANCSDHGNVSGGGFCVCDDTYNGSACQYSNQHECNNNGHVNNIGVCDICFNYTSIADGKTKQYLGDKCQYSDNTTCGNGNIVDKNGGCHYILQDGDIIRFRSRATGPTAYYLIAGQFGCIGIYGNSLSLQQNIQTFENCEFKWTKSTAIDLPNQMIGTLKFSNSLSPYYNKYVSIQKDQVNSGCYPNFENVIHRILYVSNDINTEYAELSLISQGNGVFKIKPTHELNTSSNYLSMERVCERFADQGGILHEDYYKQFGGLNRSSHTLAGFGDRLMQPNGFLFVVEKKGRDGRFYPVDSPPAASVVTPVNKDRISTAVNRLLKIQGTILRMNQGLKLNAKLDDGSLKPVCILPPETGYTLGFCGSESDFDYVMITGGGNDYSMEDSLVDTCSSLSSPTENDYLTDIEGNLDLLEKYGLFANTDYYLSYISADSSVKNIVISNDGRIKSVKSNTKIGNKFQFDIQINEGINNPANYYNYGKEGEQFDIKPYLYNDGTYRKSILKALRCQTINLIGGGGHYNDKDIVAKCDDLLLNIDQFVKPDAYIYHPGQSDEQILSLSVHQAACYKSPVPNASPVFSKNTFYFVKQTDYTKGFAPPGNVVLNHAYIQTSNSYSLGLGCKSPLVGANSDGTPIADTPVPKSYTQFYITPTPL